MSGDDDFIARLDAVEARIAAACERACRPRDGVRLLAVTKTHGPDVVNAALRAGLRLFGENRVQEAAAKIPLCGAADWHLIGHLQRNKVRHALALFECIHAVDSIPLLEAIARDAEESGRRPDLMLEVNVAGDAAKFGFRPDAVADALRAAADIGAPPVVGLMTIPVFTPDPEGARQYFRALRELRDHLQDETGFALPELSMGMSNDFEVAIEEGATTVRVGTALFGRRNASKPSRPATDGYSSYDIA